MIQSETAPAEQSTAPAFQPQQVLLSPPEVAAILSLSPTTLYRMIAQGLFPAGVKVAGGKHSRGRSGAARWHRNTVDKWLAEKFEDATPLELAPFPLAGNDTVAQAVEEAESEPEEQPVQKPNVLTKF
ncbi:AlpA family transcriptional regulator [Aliiroseovarius crassostreae]|uniref:helix-turn-helix transcriptional regulator n=1 Tax=Aliiroseovarius crassostreae TaxID=154981 RepID=UPI00220DEC41|nr:helix-turn-helix domain-containing protein [Aliiroseovarius crassostreae]UWQ05942.1 helix-turn-helix domain-containing protein [Aliiroseovarius crassostreae]